MRRLQGVGHLAQVHVAHVPVAYLAFTQPGTLFRPDGVFGEAHPGVVVFIQRQADKGAIGHTARRVVECLFQQQAVVGHRIALERAFVVPQVEVTATQTARRHGMALRHNPRITARVAGPLLGQGVAHRDDEDLGLRGLAKLDRAVDVDMGVGPGVPLSIGQLADIGFLFGAHSMRSLLLGAVLVSGALTAKRRTLAKMLWD